MHASDAPDHIVRARMPRWLLPRNWPSSGGQPALADLHSAQGRMQGMAPHDPARPPPRPERALRPSRGFVELIAPTPPATEERLGATVLFEAAQGYYRSSASVA